MAQEEKQLLLQDLCARLPYNVMCICGKYNGQLKLVCPDGDYCILQNSPYAIGDIKPYLRPMSNMTEEEENEYYSLGILPEVIDIDYRSIDWLNAHHFDVRNLIEKGLAIEAPEGMYKV